jgi:predicted ArsR family transcriptional regulator
MTDTAKSPGELGGRRLDVLQVLQAADAPMSIVAIADVLDVHPNTVRFHLDTLVSEGRVEHTASDHKGRGRPAQMFAAVRQMDPGGTRHYRLLAEILTLGLAADSDPSSKALAAGRAWGKRVKPPPRASKPGGVAESVDHLVDLLDELGFAPERSDSEGTEREMLVRLRHCPFLELAKSRTDVVCPIHLGLMQGALDTWGAPVEVGRLDAFAEPDLCLAHLTALTAGDRGPAGSGVRVEHSAAGPTRVEEITG